MFDPASCPPDSSPSAGGPLRNAAAPARPPDPFDRLTVLYKRRWLAIIVFVIAAAGMRASTWSAIPMYRASAKILIQDERSTAVGTLNSSDPVYWQDPEPYYNTQHRILESRALALRVVRQLNAAGSSTPLGSPDVESPQESDAIDGFLGGIRIEPLRGTRLVDVSFDATSGEVAARAANAIAEQYVAYNLELRLASIQRMLIWLSEELERQRQKLTASEQALTEYRSGQDAFSLDDRQNLVTSRLNALNDALSRARTARVQKETLYTQVRAAAEGPDPANALPSAARTVSMQDTRARLSALLADKAQLSGRYGPMHPEIAKLDAAIENARRELQAEALKSVEQLKAEYLTALNEERSLGRSLDEQKAAALELDRKGGSYTVLKRQAESDRKVYEQLLQQEKELRVVSNSRANNVQIMDRAKPPKGPFTPNSRRDWLTALLFGMVAAIALTLGVEALDDTVKTPDEVTRRFGLTLLGLVPAVSGRRVPLLTGKMPQPFSESFRALRTALVFTSGAESTRTIVVTSSQPLEGKTTTACNLASALALGGARVLLIDADLRRPSLHTALEVSNEAGLSHVLAGLTELGAAIRPTDQPNLSVITAGTAPANPSELLASNGMKTLLAGLEDFDWVIIDTPPVLPVTDAVVLAQAVWGVVFVIGAESTRRPEVERALDLLRGSGRRLIGAVLNRVDLTRNKYYYLRYGYGVTSYAGYAQPVAAPAFRVRIRVARMSHVSARRSHGRPE
jgi:capsular exopolysaccharide synthesis family protein